MSFEGLPLELAPDRPWGLLADLHGNLEALGTVTAELDRLGITEVLVLGDLVGYGASPSEVVAWVRERGWPSLVGNHEQMFLGRVADLSRIKERALRSLAWSQQRLTPADHRFLSALPSAARLPHGHGAVHGAPVDPNHCFAYLYDLSLDLNVRRSLQLGFGAGTVWFVGHTHRPACFVHLDDENHELPMVPGVARRLDPRGLHFINPGSVGYPRDGDPRASFAVFEPTTREFTVFRLPYDLESAAARIERAGYSPEMAQRLRLAK